VRKGSRIWITRSQPGADATAARLRERGFEPVVRPVLEAQTLEDIALDLTGIDALAFTSGAAITAFARLSPRRDLAVFTVGDATATLARAMGFAEVRSAGGDAAALASAIAAAPQRPSLVLHPGAEEPAADLASMLAQAGVAARAQAVYRTVATELDRTPEAIDAVLLHSPKAAHIVAALVSRGQAVRMVAFAVSPAVAEPLRGTGFAALAVAPHPDEPSLLNLLGD
jgi:uroporphyrinogen-III synthase